MANEAYLLGNTAMAAFLQTSFAPAVAGYWSEYSSISNAATDYSSLATPGNKAITVPHISKDAAVAKTTQTTLVYGAGTVQSAPTITMNSQYALAYLIEDITQLQTSVDIFNSFARMAGESLSNSLDSLLATTVKGETTNTAITTGTNNTVTWANLLTAQSTFGANRIQIRNCAMGIAPGAFELSVADWGDKFYSAAYRGTQAQEFPATGVEGTVLGMRVFISSDWTSGATDECATIWHPSALGFAHSGVRIIGPTPEPLHVGEGFAVHDIMGCTVLNAYGVLKIVNG